MKPHKRSGWRLAYGALLAAFTLYVLLDTFVIVRVYAPVSPAQVTASPEASAQALAQPTAFAAPTITESSYVDNQISISITEDRIHDTTVYVAQVTLSSPEYLRSAFAQQAYGRNVTAATSEIAQQVQAILAINGDFYGSREAGYVIRNGVLYRDTPLQGQTDLVIYRDGSFGLIREEEISAAELLAQGAMQVYSFGPALVADGQVSVSSGEEVGKAKSSNPRTAIGIVDACRYLLVVSDGRTAESAGLSLSQLGEYMAALGAVTAYNLDGGGSSTMVFLGEVINQPTTSGRSIQERSVSDIVYIGYE